ncbi:MAG TPA: serine/threonine protein kinase [Oceanospirillales bacterium]|nr:serine/threonine protein kinase [Oceanospirillales bacterium]
MNKEVWQKIESIYDQATDIDKMEQKEFVKNKARGDDQVIAQVLKMLEADAQTFMQDSPQFNLNLDELDFTKLDTLGHFKIIRKVATGGMGRVYLAQSSHADVPIKVALKTIRIELINSDLEHKFQNEKHILAKLQHHNIASLIDAGVTENKIPYIATQWIDGRNINQYSNDKALTIKERLNLFLQICSAVSFAHNKLIIHRDLKPDNILVDAEGQVKLLDFGIAKIIDDNQASSTQTQIYTPDYAAPEQINGEMCTVATDVYSLGIVLFELLTNHKRFDLSNMSMAEKIKAICAAKPIDINKLMQQHTSKKTPVPYSPKINGILITIINKATHLDPSRRYENVSALVADIKNYLAQRPIVAMKDSVLYQSKMFLLRNKLASFLTLVTLLAVVGGLYVSNQQMQMKLKESQKAAVLLDFFQGILQSASPAQGGSTNISVKQMFDSGIARYDFDNITDPYIKAELSSQIGLIYGQLGNLEKHREYIESALDYYVHNLDSKNNADAYLKYATEIASTYTNNEEYDKASALLLAALTRVEKYSLNPANLAGVYLELATIEKEINRYKDTKVTPKAQAYLKQAESLLKGTDNPMLIGEVNMFKHDFGEVPSAEAMAYIETAEQNFSKAQEGGFNPNLQDARSVRAHFLMLAGKYQQAEQLYEKIRQATLATYGSDDFVGLITQADNLNILGRFDKAKALLQEAQIVHEEFNLAKNPPYYGSLLYRAQVMVEYQEFAQAAELFAQNFAYFSKILPETHSYLKIAQSQRSELYLKSGNDEKLALAKLQLEKYLADNAQNKKLSAYFRYALHIKLGNINLYFKDYAKAFEHYNKAQVMTESNPSRFNQARVYWELQTGWQLARIKNGESGQIGEFGKNKKILLDRVSNDDWYDEFYSLD